MVSIIKMEESEYRSNLLGDLINQYVNHGGIVIFDLGNNSLFG